ncbi:hypothetical protein HYU50_00130 [Candidatus Woesearchaeota archaeon]|nr:hypothetical protein [Candidatus Woesearchaeota archaeon]
MFKLEIEDKIVDFIKKSPLGVSSTDIASYLGINRITITKYLAVIKQKSLIDFKQFGMAKLWYIPVNISKENFLSKIMSSFILNLPKGELKGTLEKSGISLGEEINRMYIDFYGTKKLGFDQLCDAYADIGKKLGGSFKVVSHHEKISVEIVNYPFEEANKEAMNTLFSAVFAKIASLNLGYARALALSKDSQNTVIDVFLKKEETQKL